MAEVKSDSLNSSRLIIKNLPSKFSEERLKSICGQLGLVTDCQLKFTKSGLFRKFAFVGFRTIEEAQSAKDYLNNTFIDASRIQVEFCQRLNVATKRTKDKTAGKLIEEPSKTTMMAGRPEVIIENLPQNVKKKNIKQFLIPIKPLRVDVSSDKYSAVIKLQKKSDVKIVMKLNGKFFGGNKLTIRTLDNESKADVIDERPLEVKTLQQQTEIISETGRLFVRNIPYVCTLSDLQALFEKYGPLAEIKLPLDSVTKNHKGYAIVSFVLPEHALKAFSETDGIVFNGRMLHIVPGEDSKIEKNIGDANLDTSRSSFKKKKVAEQKASSSIPHNWNTLFLGANAVADVLVDKLNAEKSDLLDPTSKTSLGIRMALGETQLVRETREFLLQNGVSLDSFETKKHFPRSTTVIVAKNLPANTTTSELRELFSKYGDLGRVVVPDAGISALVEFLNEQHAKKAFKSLAYKRFKTTPLFLEWAPGEVFSAKFYQATGRESEKKEQLQTAASEEHDEVNEETESGSTIFVKNLNFTTTDDLLKQHFEKIGRLNYATVAKKTSGRAGELLSMGYGFVQFKKRSDASKAIKVLQKKELEGFALELKLSERESAGDTKERVRKEDARKTAESDSNTKLLVRNIPFQANKKEITEMFSTFGELRSVRLPKKAGAQSHRGFGFVDFTNKSDAQKAFEALSHSTHLYGRRLVLAWAAEEESLEELRKRVADFGSVSRSAASKQQKIMLENLE